jgi:hypothetical protein
MYRPVPVEVGSLALTSATGDQTVVTEEWAPVQFTCTTGYIRPSNATVHWFIVMTSGPDTQPSSVSTATTTSTGNSTTSSIEFPPTREHTAIYCRAANAANKEPVNSNRISINVTCMISFFRIVNHSTYLIDFCLNIVARNSYFYGYPCTLYWMMANT